MAHKLPPTARKTLRNVLPHEFFGCEYTESPVHRYVDREIAHEMDGRHNPWPGPHKNVMVWWLLAGDDGRAVGWNENPGRGWTFVTTITPSHR